MELHIIITNFQQEFISTSGNKFYSTGIEKALAILTYPVIRPEFALPVPLNQTELQ